MILKEERILVIIPAYNEQERISEVINSVKNTLPEAKILVINDGSFDDTKIVAEQSGALVVSLVLNMGYGIALQTGYKYAQKNHFKYILQLDADGQHEPSFLRNILEELVNSDADVIIGSRFMHKDSYRPIFIKRVGMEIFSILSSKIIKQRISDPTSGFLGFRKSVLTFLISDYFPVDYPDADTIIMMHKCGFKIKEIPVLMRPNLKNTMHSGLRPIYYVFKMFLSVFINLLRKHY